MGQTWDGGDVAFQPETWAAVFRVLKPGAFLLAFSGTRTQHRMVCAIEDAGFEIRDQIGWAYGSGFPKSLDVSKQLDLQEKTKWLNIVKAIDATDQSAMVAAWIEHSRSAHAAVKFEKSQTEAGLHTLASGSALGLVRLSVSPEKSAANAIIAEVNSSAAHPTTEVLSASAQWPAAGYITASNAPATSADSLPGSPDAIPETPGSSARPDALASPDASTSHLEAAAEALMIWLGSKPFSDRAATDALFAALADALKRTTLSQSATFRSLDTMSQTDFASATTATTTSSTAALLISFTVDTLKRKAIDKAAGAEREVVGKRQFADGTFARDGALMGQHGVYGKAAGCPVVTAPATPEAAAWQGWGTALKPAWESICVARKPLAGTVAANVLAHGTGALNIDGCRIEADARPLVVSDRRTGNAVYGDGLQGSQAIGSTALGRWPANLCHDGSDEVLACFPESKDGVAGKRTGVKGITTSGLGGYADEWGGYGGSGSAARFFYTAKASKAERGDGNTHPTVKPVALMRWLVRLVTPPGGMVLDPFAGSGTTGLAASIEQFNATLIEMSPEYAAIARGRIDREAGLFGGVAAE
jgi:hypothetical protein